MPNEDENSALEVLKGQIIAAEENLEKKRNRHDTLTELFHDTKEAKENFEDTLKVTDAAIVTAKQVKVTKIANEEQMATIIGLEKKRNELNENINVSNDTLQYLKSELTRLENEIREAENDKNILEKSNKRTIVGAIQGSLAAAQLKTIQIPKNHDGLDDADTVSLHERSPVRNSSIDSNDSTLVNSFIEEPIILSSSEKQFQEKIKEIQNDKERFNSLYTRALDIGYELDEIDELIENIETGGTEVGAELSALNESLDNKTRQFILSQKTHDDLEPKTTVGRFLHGVNKFFRGLVGGKTPFETAKAHLEKTKQKISTTENEIKAKINQFRSEIEEREKIKIELTEEQSIKSKEISQIAQQYSIPSNSKLSSEFYYSANVKFDAQIKNHETSLDDLMKRKAALINRCEPRAFSTLYRNDADTVKQNLRLFLKNPTQRTLTTLKVSMQDHPKYVDNNELKTLLKEARTYYETIPQVADAPNQSIVDMEFREITLKIVQNEKQINELNEQKSELQTSIERTGTTISAIQDKVEINLSAFKNCHNLLIIAKQREEEFKKSTDEKEKNAHPYAEQLVAYLTLKKDQILQTLPEQAKREAETIPEDKTVIPKIDYELCRQEITRIFLANDITVPTEMMTRESITALCETHSNGQSILNEIKKLQGIEEQVVFFNKKLIDAEQTIFRFISKEKPSNMQKLLSEIDTFASNLKELVPNKTDHDAIVDVLNTFHDELDSEPPGKFQNALTQLEIGLGNYENQCPSLINTLSDFDSIDGEIGPIESIKPSEISSFNNAMELTTSTNHKISNINLKIRQLKADIEGLTKIRNQLFDSVAEVAQTQQPQTNNTSSIVKPNAKKTELSSTLGNAVQAVTASVYRTLLTSMKGSSNKAEEFVQNNNNTPKAQ